MLLIAKRTHAYRATLRISALITGISLLPALGLSSQLLTNDSPLRSMVKNHCVSCHNPEKTKGELDLESILDVDMSQHFETWDEVAWMLEEREMPPEDTPPDDFPTASEYDLSASWLKKQLSDIGGDHHPETAISSKLGVINKYCISCHNADEKEGGMNFETVRSEEILENTDVWERVIKKLESRQMPPTDRQRPGEATYEAVLANLIGTIDKSAAEQPDPGRTDTFRRLNRTEYQNAIRDLLAIDVNAATLLPKDEESHGFDNITVGNLSPGLLDRYISAAQKISRLAVGVSSDRPEGHTVRIPADFTQEKHIEGLPIGTRGGALLPYTFPQDGEYEIEVMLTRDRNEHVEGLNGRHEMEILLDRAVLGSFTVEPPKGRRDHSQVDDHLKTRTFINAGPKQIGVTFIKKPYSLLETKRQPFEAHYNYHRHPRLSPAVYQISITGPYNGQGAKDTPSREKLFIRYPKNQKDELPAARDILTNLMKKAYRRSITKADLEQPLTFYKDAAKDHGFEAGIEAALSSILVNPEFIFKIEREPKGLRAGTPYRVSDLELASRLSFFIWSSIPDDELLDEAIAGGLSHPEGLEKQVRRMLADEKASNLANNFADQWLHLRNLQAVTPDLRLYPDFDDNLRQSFKMETELFFESVLRDDGSVLDLIKSDYTFLNERLAQHYGIPNVFGSRFRKVQLKPEYNRGGLLRQGSVLTVTSYATRTSPVIRGHWILENIIGTPPPPPPPDVPALEENSVDQTLSMRDLLAEHRANPACAGCHNLMDPVGFALENFDAIGRWREFENGAPVDATGGLPDGSLFNGVAPMEDGLLDRPELFVRTLSEKLLTFALGRGVEYHDAPAVRKIVKDAEMEDYRFSSLVLGIVNSVPFQMRNKLEEEYASIEP